MAIDNYALYEDDSPTADGFERELIDSVSPDEPWKLVERFSELERVSGSADEREAADYLTDRLEAHDIPNDRYTPELWLSIPHNASLAATSPTEATFDSAKTISFSESGTVEGEVVYLEGPSADTMEEMLNASIGNVERDIEGKIVLLEAMSLSTETIANLQNQGAKAFIGIHPHPDEPHEGIATPIWGAVPEPGDRERFPQMPITNVSRADGGRLIELARGDAPLEVELSADLTRDWFECPLVTARIPGEAAPDSDDFVLLHGHYDSWHVGIADNATGDAGLLELARVFNEHRDRLSRDLWIAWWPGHSTGRYAGSTWFADEFAHELVENCVAQVNMDSPGAADATEFTMTMRMPEADGLVRDAIADVAGKESPEVRPPRAGDYSFNNLGLSGLFMLSSNIPEDVRDARGYHPVGGCGGNSNAWHLTTDTLDKADPDVLIRDIQVYAYALSRLLIEDVVPLDHRHTIEVHREALVELDDTVGDHFDLSPVLDELAELDDAVAEFYDAVEAEDIDAGTANETIKSLSRSLVRLDFTSKGPFEQDPAFERPHYPALAPATNLPELEGDEYKFQKIHLKRALNGVVHELRRTCRTLPTNEDH
jgi:hypothetical protein